MKRLLNVTAALFGLVVTLPVPIPVMIVIWL
jgi:lipopolysaccharide/colanic/teichoic acid biosynthesis glycosyltransferase